MAITFENEKILFDDKYGTAKEIDCFLPVHLTIGGKENDLYKKDGSHNEQYYKWQFLYCFVSAGLCSKDFIGVEVSFPKGNKNSASIKLDAAIFDNKDWFEHYSALHTKKDDSKWDELNWLKEHLICGIEFKKEGSKDIKGVFNSQLKAYMNESSKETVFGILYDEGRLYLFKGVGKQYLRLSDEFNIENKGKIDATYDVPDPYVNLLSFDGMLKYNSIASQLTDYSGRHLIDLGIISKTDSRKLNDALYQILHTMDKCGLVKENGVICLLMPSKGLLFNRSSQSSMYRKRLFDENTVSVIINFSIYRRVLFDNATAPCTAIIYYPKKENESDTNIFYCTPKPQYSLQDTKKFSIDPTDICRIPSDLVYDDRIWKIAMWGSPRDLELIDKMQSTYPSMEEFISNHNMCSAEGFIRGRGGYSHKELLGYPIVDVRGFVPFYTSNEGLMINKDDQFYRCSLNNREIFKAPHLIMKQSHRKGRFFASVLDYDAIFNHSLLGISGDERILKYLCLIINSKVFSYYHLLTSRTWMVERDALEAGDIRTIPIPEPSEEMLGKAVELYEHIKISGDESLLDAFVFDAYRLKDYETYLVTDALDYIYNYFDKKSNSIAFKKPSIEVYRKYYSTFMDVLKNSLGQSFTPKASFYIGESPLSILVLSISENSDGDLIFFDNNKSTEQCLSQLDSLLTEERYNIYIRRNVRVYGKDSIYIVKPKQQKYWNYSSACRDADELFSDIMKAKG